MLLNSLSPELNPICYSLALLAHYFLQVSRIRFNMSTHVQIWNLAEFFVERESFHTDSGIKKSKHFFVQNFSKITSFVTKCGRTQNSLLWCIATIVTPTHNNVILCIRCLSYLFLSSTGSVRNINFLAFNLFPWSSATTQRHWLL
jgi:hypothetical protein